MDERMRRSIALTSALRTGDLGAARAALEAPDSYPNAVDGSTGSTILQLARFDAPVATVASLLVAGADPNFVAVDGFPAVLLVILHRDDAAERATLAAQLLARGADPNARGINDWTALHGTATRGDAATVRLLLDAGADPTRRTRIDDLTSPADEAEAAGHTEFAARLRSAVAG